MRSARADMNEHETRRRIRPVDGVARLSEEVDTLYSDMRTVLPRLRDRLRGSNGEVSPIASRPPGRPQGEPGMALRPHQQSGLLFMLQKDEEQGGGIIGDAPGLGKTALACAYVVASNEIAARQEPNPITGPTLIAVPTQLVKKNLRDYSRTCGDQYRVLRFGNAVQPHIGRPTQKLSVSFSQDNSIIFRQIDGAPVGNNLVVISHERHSYSWDPHRDGRLAGLFSRIIVDKGQALRCCGQTKRGAVLMSMPAPLRWIMTGTVMANGLTDFLGYCAFLASQSAMSNDQDRNLAKFGANCRAARDFFSQRAERQPTFPNPETVRAHPDHQRLLSIDGHWQAFPDAYYNLNRRTIDDMNDLEREQLYKAQSFPAVL